MVTKEGQISNIMSNYFTEITRQIYLKQDVIKLLTTSSIVAFKNNESILRIKSSNFFCNRKFLFLKCYSDEVKEKLLNLSSKKCIFETSQLKEVTVTFQSNLPIPLFTKSSYDHSFVLKEFLQPFSQYFETFRYFTKFFFPKISSILFIYLNIRLKIR